MIRTACLGFVLLSGWTLLAAEPDPRRPAAIEVENVPVVPTELVNKLRQYQAIRHARFRGWSPDGKGILIQTQFGNTPQLHKVLTPGGDRTQLTFEEEPTDGRFIPHRADGILTLMSSGGNENDQLYWQPFNGQSKLLTDGKSRHLLGPISQDGKWIIVASNRRNGRDMDLLRGDLTNPGTWTDLLQVNNETWEPVAFSPDAKQLLIMRVISINDRYPALLDVETGKVTLIPHPPGTKGKVAIDSGAFAPDGKSVYLTSDANSEYLQIAKVNLSEFTYEWLTADIPHDIDHLEIDRQSGRLAFTANEDGASGLYLLDASGKRDRLKLPLGIVDSLEFDVAGQNLGLTLARPNAPADVYSIAIKDGEVTRWTTSETGGLNPGTFIEPALVKYPTFDQREIPAYVFKPKGASKDKRAPVLISIHGGPESQYRPIFVGSDQFYLNELGLAVICPNVRGSAGQGKTYLQLDNAEKRLDSVKDIGALLDWIKTQPDLDPDRVAVMGGSYGGFMVLASLVMHGERIRAGVDVVGISDFVTFLNNTSEYRRDLRRVEYGDERDPAMRAVFDKISPARNASKIKSELMVAHGKNDPRVPFSEAKQIAPLVRANGKDVWTVYADNEGHGFRKKDNRDYFTAVIALFLQKHLQTSSGPVSYKDHQDLRYYLDRNGQRQTISKPEDWEIRRQHVLSSLQEVMGPLPGANSRVPLDAKVISESQIGSITRKKITYQSDADDRVTAWLLIPEKAAEKKLPAVLCLQQTTPLGKDEPAGLAGNPNLHYALHLAERGYITLAPDYPSFGEHPYDFAPQHGYASGSMKAIWDNIRAVDLLTSFTNVDSERIGCIGHSLGGHNALFTSVFEPRLKVIVSSCGFCTFLKDDVPSWNGPRYMPRIATVCQNSADKVPFDFTEIIGSLAPRPFLACAAVGDDDFDVSGVKDVMAAAKPVYQLFGKEGNLQAYYPEGPHDFPADARDVAYRFLDQHLKP